ncbi:DNA -binding domain-containing protein [Allosphingosinicella sp.]|uniref:DNA -binding domain-containing protein n=1 Tax=Allosphingosinicella sp. TaxID=2823234 RepID=UPI002FC122D8
MDEAGVEHVVLSDGWQHIRLDIENGSLLAGEPVILHYRLAGLGDAEPKLLPLRRLIALVRHRRFLRTLIVPDVQMRRHLLALRVHDALSAGASQREIADVLFGSPTGSSDRADSLRSRVRRLARESRRLATGGWRTLMRRSR